MFTDNERSKQLSSSLTELCFTWGLDTLWEKQIPHGNVSLSQAENLQLEVVGKDLSVTHGARAKRLLGLRQQRREGWKGSDGTASKSMQLVWFSTWKMQETSEKQ